MNQEVRLLAHITLELPVEWEKSDIMYTFSQRHMSLKNRDDEAWEVIIDVIEIEEEAELYNLE